MPTALIPLVPTAPGIVIKPDMPIGNFDHTLLYGFCENNEDGFMIMIAPYKGHIAAMDA